MMNDRDERQPLKVDRLKSLDGARGLAAVMVVLGHAQSSAGSYAVFRGQPAVDLFFTLSGFVLSFTYLRGQPIIWKDFALARFARIYPLHIATACTMAVLSVVYAAISDAPWPTHINTTQAMREFTLTMAMPVVGSMKLWNFPAWSISVEWWTYFTVFPLIVIFSKRLNSKVALAMFAALAVPLAWWLYSDIKPTRYEPAFARALVGFAGGWIAWRFYNEGGRAIPGYIGTTFAVLFLLATVVSPMLFHHDAWFLIPFYPALVCSFVMCDSMVSRLLSRSILIWLGTISYSIYLIHPIMLNVIEAIDARVVKVSGALVWMALTLLLTLIASTASYYWFENPIRLHFKKIRDRRSKPWAAAV